MPAFWRRRVQASKTIKSLIGETTDGGQYAVVLQHDNDTSGTTSTKPDPSTGDSTKINRNAVVFYSPKKSVYTRAI